MTADNKCCFCGNECDISQSGISHRVKDYGCSYCGDYFLHEKLVLYGPVIKDPSSKFKMACVLNERRLKGLGGIAVSAKMDTENSFAGRPLITVDDILDEFPKKAGDFLNRALLNLSRLPALPYELIALDLEGKSDWLHLFRRGKQASCTFLRELEKQGLIRFDEVARGGAVERFFPDY